MPAVRTGGLGAGEKLVQISEMEDWAQLAFDGYKCAHLLLAALKDFSIFNPWPESLVKEGQGF